MKNMEKQGICKKWQTGRKQIVNNGLDWINTHDLSNLKLMKQYADTGVKPEFPEFGAPPDPPLQRWEFRLDDCLAMYGQMRCFEMEIRSLDSEHFDVTCATNAFAAIYTYEFINLNRRYLFPQRFDGRFLDWGELDHVPYVALGMLLGRHEQAATIARLFLVLARMHYFKELGESPCRFFILQLMTVYLGEPLLPFLGRTLSYPTYMQLLNAWRTPDLNELTPLCLTVCDLHTHHVFNQPDGLPGDFDDFLWRNTPIEILLLFKLRQLIGLENPVLDHPLMNTVLGVLPEEKPFEPDELINRLRARMETDGYDEVAIAKRILTNEYGLPERQF